MEILSKSQFAARCGVSKPTVFAWIKRNKDGIADYITPDGIKETIFSMPPWDQIDSKPKNQTAAAQLREELAKVKAALKDSEARYQIDMDAKNLELSESKAAYQIDMDAARRQITELSHQVELLRLKVDDLTKSGTEKDGYIQTLTVMLNRQQAALNPPKKGIFKRLKEWIAGTGQDQAGTV